MVDWALARQISRLTAGAAETERPLDIGPLCATAAEHVARYTGLWLNGPLPEAEQLDRAGWADMNLETFAGILGPVADRLAGRMSAAGPLAGPLRAVTGATLAAEVGLVTGYLSQRVLGQYEISLLQGNIPPRLVFVGPNLEQAVRTMDVDRDSFLGWVALHEVTHVFQFSGVTWLRPHIERLLREYLETVEVRIERGAAGALPSMPDPARIVEAFREGGLAALVQTRGQRLIMDRIQATMAVIEGYSEHVMDAVGVEMLPAYAGLRAAMERRRQSRSAPEQILQRLLGLDMKMRQYELGRRFCDTVAEQGGIEGLGRVWSAPHALPTPRELTRPLAWIARIEREAALAA